MPDVLSDLPLRIIPAPGVRDRRGSLHLIERHARAYRYAWVVFISGLSEPLFYLLAIGVGVGHLVGTMFGPGGQRIDFASFVAPGLLAAASMNGAVMDSTFSVFSRLKFSKLYESMLGTPMQVSDIAVGEVGWSVLRAGIYAVAFMIVILALGLAHSAWAAAAVPAALLIGFAFAGAGMAATTFMTSWQHFEFITLTTLPMFLFSTTFYPLSVYPRAVQVIVECTPLYQGVALLRGLFFGAVGPGMLWHVGYLAVMGLAGVALSMRRFRVLLLK
jgi:lipooligosaccharide transport system permease protein